MAEDEAAVGLEVVVEDHGHGTALRSLVTTLTGQSGTQSFRFAARPLGSAETADEPELVSATFPVSPLQLPPDHFRPGDAWSDEITAALTELDRAVQAHGWTPSGRGDHWWSLRYRRAG